MRRRGAIVVLVVGALAAACRRGDAPRPAAPLTDALLGLAAPGEPDAARAREAIAGIAARVREARTAGADPASAMARVLFDELGFSREVDDQSARFMLLPSVLAQKRGSCVGLAALYLALGEALQIPVQAVLVPGHLFVRVLDGRGRLRNVELLRRGEEMPEEWYRRRYGVPQDQASGASAYLRPLSAGEVLAVVNYNLGNDLRVHGRLLEARDAYTRAAVAFPSFAEAQASLGLARHLLGDLEGAAQAYAAARRARPDLPGLDGNVSVLRQEREQRP